VGAGLPAGRLPAGGCHLLPRGVLRAGRAAPDGIGAPRPGEQAHAAGALAGLARRRHEPARRPARRDVRPRDLDLAGHPAHPPAGQAAAAPGGAQHTGRQRRGRLAERHRAALQRAAASSAGSASRAAVPVPRHDPVRRSAERLVLRAQRRARGTSPASPAGAVPRGDRSFWQREVVAGPREAWCRRCGGPRCSAVEPG
jgi:hypothetical protein